MREKSSLDGDWICVRTQPRRELWAKKNIERCGVPVLLPMIEVPAPDKNKTPQIKPLFPSYLFACIKGQWYFLFGTFGVRGPLLRAGAPEVVPLRAVRALQNRMDEGGLYRSTQRLTYRRGEQLDIKGGPFKGLCAIYEGMTAQERIKVLLNIFGRGVLATVSAQHVSKSALTCPL